MCHFPDLNADVLLKILQPHRVRLGDDQQVARGDGLEIHKSDHRVVFVDDAGVRFPPGYCTEDASVVRHGLSPQNPSTSCRSQHQKRHPGASDLPPPHLASPRVRVRVHSGHRVAVVHFAPAILLGSGASRTVGLDAGFDGGGVDFAPDSPIRQWTESLAQAPGCLTSHRLSPQWERVAQFSDPGCD